VTHPERGEAILNRLAEELSELATVDQRPTQDGRNMTMMLGPSKSVIAGTVDEDAKAEQDEAAAAASAGDGDAAANAG
jgi:translation initiation factor IF-3